MCSPCNIAFFKQSGRHPFFGKRYKIGFLRILKNPFWGKKAELLPARFQGPPKMGVAFFGLFFSCFSVSSASSKRVLKTKLFSLGFLNTLLKHLVTSCSNNQLNPQTPPPPKKKEVHNFFLPENPFFDQKQLLKTQNLHHPLKTVH